MDYKQNYRQIRLFKVQYRFTKHAEDMPVINQIGYFLAFDMTGAHKECLYQYSRGDRKWVEIGYLEDVGHPVGIHHFV